MVRRLPWYRLLLRRWSSVAGGALLLLVLVMAGIADWEFPQDPFEMVAEPLLAPFADAQFPLGTDALGRDIAAGIFHGARLSLAIGVISTAAALLLGGTVGAVAGYYRGRVDDALMRVTELFQTMPAFMFVIVLVSIFQPKIVTIVLALAVASWPPVARLVRAEFLSLRQREFVQSCVVIGMSDRRIMLGQILPNALAPVIVTASVMVASAILMEAGLSFLGLGDPNVMSWGSMIGAGRDEIRSAWYISAIPGCALLATVLGLNLFGEGLNDALNPRLRPR
jgi:peptide/nickel transport system permease protein